MIVIVDYGVGNLASIQNMLKKIGKPSVISSDISDIKKAEKLILPGVGSFDTCAAKLQQSGIITTLEKKVLEQKTPILGICVGLQLLSCRSEEGNLPGLGWIKGEVVHFRSQYILPQIKIPHMGWTDIKVNKNSQIASNMENARFYFAHTYHLITEEVSDVLFSSYYGYKFISGIEKENIFGVQFHPEKSHRFGLQLLSNFILKIS